MNQILIISQFFQDQGQFLGQFSFDTIWHMIDYVIMINNFLISYDFGRNFWMIHKYDPKTINYKLISFSSRIQIYIHLNRFLYDFLTKHSSNFQSVSLFNLRLWTNLENYLAIGVGLIIPQLNMNRWPYFLRNNFKSMFALTFNVFESALEKYLCIHV